ncbi:MAG: DUF255 domain-containing protein [Bacteroidetes bacterium]|nr:DUF255 domain-containing protein [Bacteroidota bacterium]
MNVYVSWCRWCRQMKDSVFTNKEIAHYINQHFYRFGLMRSKKKPYNLKAAITNLLMKEITMFTSYLVLVELPSVVSRICCFQ